MTRHEQWTDRLSDYLDGELTPDEAAAVDAHLRGCASCADVLNDLKRVVARAQAAAAAPRPPQADLWGGIAGRIDAASTPAARSEARGQIASFDARSRRRITFTLPQLAAAAIVVAAVSGGVGWQLSGGRIGTATAVPYATSDNSGSGANAARDGSGGTATAVPYAPSGDSGSAANVGQDRAAANVGHPFRGAGRDGGIDAQVETVGLADAQYDAAVVDLEKALNAGRGRLDASTVAIVEHNLEIIDQAINQAREALVGDPANTYLSSHLVEARRRKLDLLRHAAALTTAMD